MNLTERVKKNRGEVAEESSRAELKEVERADAVRKMEEIEKTLAGKQEELNMEKEKAAGLEEKLCSSEKILAEEIKKGVLLRSDFDKLQEELVKEREKAKAAVEALEKLEKEAIITYQDAVDKYQKSDEFEEFVNLRAGYLHEEGFNDCLAFVGAGNAVDLAVHNVQSYRKAALAGMEEQGGV